MIRKLILPAIATLLLAGCATGYSYRSAYGDYYYGQPTTVYRNYYGGYGYYGYPYGYSPYASPYGWSGSLRYRWDYPYYGYYGGTRWGGHRYPYRPRPGGSDGDSAPAPDRTTPPWRDLDRIRGESNVLRSEELDIRQQTVRPGQRSAPVQQPQAGQRISRPIPRQRSIQGPVPQEPRRQTRERSNMSELIQRAKSD